VEKNVANVFLLVIALITGEMIEKPEIENKKNHPEIHSKK
jgi:hypothetical protein